MTFSLLRTRVSSLAVYFCVAGVTDRRCDAGDGLLVASGGVASRLDYYTYEATRWRNAPEGSLMVRRCIDAATDNAVFPVAPLSGDEWHVMAARETDCPTVAEPFEQAAENDIRALHLLMKIVLVISVCLELFMTVRARRGRGTVARWRMFAWQRAASVSSGRKIMSNRYVIEALLRPAVELNTAVVAGMAAYVCVQAPRLWRWHLQLVM